MENSELDFSLVWPRELFVWEAKRIIALPGNIAGYTEALLGEAFADADAPTVAAPAGWLDSFDVPNDKADRALLNTLISDASPIRPYRRPQYWLERQQDSTSSVPKKLLSEAFVALIEEMRELDYFPKILPKGCVDSYGSWDVDPSNDISKAIRCEVFWPDDLKPGPLSFPDDLLYSIIEYFHDQAQRPRTRSLHGWNECGYHYGDHNKASGGVVYRWRVNELLEFYGVGLRLGNQGDETGQLIQHAALNLDELGDQTVSARGTSRDTTVADAIQLYRKRAATTTDRRAAIAQLANYIELRRKEFAAVKFASNDEQDLFNIFNNFMIRHGNKTQKSDYGDEYLDWIFWTSVSAIQLIRTVSGAEERSDLDSL